MDSIKLICPYNSALIDRLNGRTLVIRVNAAGDVLPAAKHVAAQNNLHCVIFDSGMPISEIEGMEQWQHTPVALMAPSMGKFRDVAGKISMMRNLNLRVYMPCRQENLTSLMTLASLGIPCAMTFDNAEITDWDMLADVMTYALLPRVPHAGIEPFNYLSQYFVPHRSYREWGRVCFDDPSQYLHLDGGGNVALSRKELLNKNFIFSDVSELDSPTAVKTPGKLMEQWRNLFLTNHSCSVCEAWRVCGGQFLFNGSGSDGCAAFCREMLETLEQQYQTKQSLQVIKRWQP